MLDGIAIATNEAGVSLLDTIAAFIFSRTRAAMLERLSGGLGQIIEIQSLPDQRR
jgi:hypothetical protein